jgi:pyrroloquinoline quinone biosynthesis protein E
LDHKRIKELANLGLSHVQISLQDSEEDQANKIAGNSKAFKQKILAARSVRDVGLSLTVNAPIHRMNIDHIESIIQLAQDLDAARLELAHIQYYGWAYINRKFLLPTFNQLKKATDIVDNARKKLHGHMAIDYVVPDYYAKKPKSCMNGWGQQFLNVTPSGKVLPCHAAESITDLEFQNVNEHQLIDIWNHSPAFNKYRGVDWMPEICRDCERKELDWGGCRCQAFAITGDASNTDPACDRSPYHEYLVNVAELDSSCTSYDFEYRKMNRTIEKNNI